MSNDSDDRLPEGRWVFFESRDDKSSHWGEALAGRGLLSRASSGSPMLTWLHLLRAAAKRRAPTAVFFRYLNDYPSLPKTLALFASERLALAVCGLTGVAAFWICHNVDRETKRHHPRLSEARRAMFAARSEKIFVTDAGLVPKAREVFPRWASKVDYLCFGPPSLHRESEHTSSFIAEVNAFMTEKGEAAAREGRRFLRFSCIGRPGEKYDHFPMAGRLIRAAEAAGYRLAGVIVGPFIPGKYDDGGVPFFGLDAEPEIKFHGSYLPLDEIDFLGQCDFIWRGYRDWSVSYTLYKAAAIRKPVLALDTGFVGWAVREYGLGAVVRPDFSDLPAALESIVAWDPRRADEFLASHNWDAAAGRISAAIESAGKGMSNA